MIWLFDIGKNVVSMCFLCFARENSDEHWFSCPSELVSPRRD